MNAQRPQSRVLGACFALLLVAGCQGRPFGAGPEPDYGVASTQYGDIPVPDGMKLLNHPSTAHSGEAGDWRYGDFIYQGSPSLDDASRYMVLRMPQHSWKLVSEDVPTPNSRVLRFERGIYAAECRFVRESATTRMEVKYRTLPSTK